MRLKQVKLITHCWKYKLNTTKRNSRTSAIDPLILRGIFTFPWTPHQNPTKETKRPVRALSVHHRLRNVQAGRSSIIPPPSISGEGGRSIRAQEGESRLIVRGEGIVCIGKHRSKVRTIEQILFKYSRDSRSSMDTHHPASTLLRKAHGAWLSSSLRSCNGVGTVGTLSTNARKMTAVVASLYHISCSSHCKWGT
jgi:hypothetical protein